MTQPTDRDFELLSSYLDDALSGEARAALETRLNADPDLRQALDGLRRTVQLLGATPGVVPPRNFTLDPAKYRRPVPWWMRWRALQTVGAVGAFAAVVLIVLGVLLQTNTAMAPAAGNAVAAFPTNATIQSYINGTATAKSFTSTPTSIEDQVSAEASDKAAAPTMTPTGTPTGTATLPPTSTALPTNLPTSAALLQPTFFSTQAIPPVSPPSASGAADGTNKPGGQPTVAKSGPENVSPAQNGGGIVMPTATMVVAAATGNDLTASAADISGTMAAYEVQATLMLEQTQQAQGSVSSMAAGEGGPVTATSTGAPLLVSLIPPTATRVLALPTTTRTLPPPTQTLLASPTFAMQVAASTATALSSPTTERQSTALRAATEIGLAASQTEAPAVTSPTTAPAPHSAGPSGPDITRLMVIGGIALFIVSAVLLGIAWARSRL